VSAGGAPDTLLAEAVAGSRRALGRLITIAESGGAAADALDRSLLGAPGPDWVLGIVGAPGVGKSTLTGRLAAAAASDDHAGHAPRVAVIAVDPSSPLTGGAILGDRIRMQGVGDRRDVFLRSMAHRGAAGGLAGAVPISIRVLGAVGVATVLVETVGVGQIELEIVHVADTIIAAMSAGWGDAIQAGKAGLLEVADLFVVNKADRHGASDAVRDLEQMLDAGHPAAPAYGPPWRPPVCTTVATAGTGVAELWAAASAHHQWLLASGELERRRRVRLRHEIGRRATEILARRVGAFTDAMDLTADDATPDERARAVVNDICATGAPPDPRAG
jgi:LAO/AO transport system kinase